VTAHAKKLTLIVMVSVMLSVYVSSKSRVEYCTDLEITPDLRLNPVHLLDREPSSGSFYAFEHLASLTSVDHFRKRTGAEPTVRLLYLETDDQQVLDRTVKTVEILSGRFGAVYADKSCFYSRPVENTYSFVSVHSYFKHPIVKAPAEFSQAPLSLPPLTSLSLVRVFRTAPEFLIVAANYEPNGDLGSLRIDGARDGDWLSSSDVPATGDGFVRRFPDDHSSVTTRKYGIPEHIDVDAYLRSRWMPLGEVSTPEEVVVFNQHYGYNKLIQQDELKSGAVIRTRFLEPSVTEEEENVLNRLCEEKFRQQQALRLPTVQ
jgi:hypothetical protein